MSIVGIDEVGRGCWAGPLVVGAVQLREPIEGLADSKKLTKKNREVLSGQIHKSAVVGLGWVEATEVDELGLTKATILGSKRAMESILEPYDKIIIDGNINYLPDNPKSRCLTKADDTVPAVSAASIVAKVARDQYMKNESVKYKGYGFEYHVGYGTARHRDALSLYGITPLHRRSFKPVRDYVL